MINCTYLILDKCLLTKEIVGTELTTNDNICKFCQSCDKPKQLNKATASLAATYLLQNNIFDDSNPKHIEVKNILTPPILKYGPGTELKKLISWFIWIRDVDGCKACYNREQQMNQWGPEGCRSNINLIVDWLRESAAKHSLPFSETLARILINKAIRNSEKHYEVVCCGNNCT